MTRLVKITAGGIRWRLLPECRDQLVGREGLPIDEWLRRGQARVVKDGPHRTVYYVGLPGLQFYLKHYRLMDVRAWFRQLVRPSKARTEFRRGLLVAARRVPTVVPLGLGERRTGGGPNESFLITRSLEDTEPLNAFVQHTLPRFDPRRHARVRQLLARELGRLMARMHGAGIVHHDLHAGNLLVRMEGGDRPRLYLIDLHAVHVGRPLGRRARRDNLVMLNRWFLLRANRSDRLRFWKAYQRARQEDTPASWSVEAAAAVAGKDLARELERRSWGSNLRFWRHRDRRCTGNNRYYRRVRSGGVAGHAVADLDPAALGVLLENPDEPFRRPGVRLLKDSPSSTVAELDLEVGGVTRRVIYKRFRVTAWTDPWVACFRRTAALRSWVLGHGLLERNLPTARPLAVLQRRRRGLLYEGYLLTEKVPDAVDLHGFLSGLAALDPAERRAALRRRVEQVARLVRELHRRQLSQRDLKAANILLSAGPPAAVEPETGPGRVRRPNADWPVPTDPVWLIDLVGVRVYRRLPHTRRVQNLARLNAGFYQNPALTRTDRLRFLRVYLQWNLFGRGGWKKLWREIEEATAKKVVRNRRNGRPLS